LNAANSFDAKKLMSKIDKTLNYKYVKSKKNLVCTKPNENKSLYLDYLGKAAKVSPENKRYILNSPEVNGGMMTVTKTKTKNMKTQGRY
jgi:hypothetical protein